MNPNPVKVLFNDASEFAAELNRVKYNDLLVPMLRATIQFRQSDLPIVGVTVIAGFLFTESCLLHLAELRCYCGDYMRGDAQSKGVAVRRAEERLTELEALAKNMVHPMQFAPGEFALA